MFLLTILIVLIIYTITMMIYLIKVIKDDLKYLKDDLQYLKEYVHESHHTPNKNINEKSNDSSMMTIDKQLDIFINVTDPLSTILNKKDTTKKIVSTITNIENINFIYIHNIPDKTNFIYKTGYGNINKNYKFYEYSVNFATIDEAIFNFYKEHEYNEYGPIVLDTKQTNYENSIFDYLVLKTNSSDFVNMIINEIKNNRV